ncbi:hypothetical protein [Helicobacter cynogastricus]|uniref:hypothetical protein n=1 Tax=Helicobacter cynogastricus TaxID=329937 RepID=UPI001315643C|nr:hypothetical protein [Helicobacter cynogastricus]
MKTILLYTEQYYPLQTGLASADYGLTLGLAQAGYQVYVITGTMFGDMRFTRTGTKGTITSGAITKETIRIAPNLWVIPFEIFHQGWWQGEFDAYIDFVCHFTCDLLINSAILTWNTDYIYDHISKCKAKKKILRSHGEAGLMATSWRERIRDTFLNFLGKRQSDLGHLRDKLKKALKHYDYLLFLHKRSHTYNYLKFYARVAILPNGIFARDICAPKQHNNTTTQQHNNTTTQQHNNTTTQQHNNTTTQQHNIIS